MVDMFPFPRINGNAPEKEQISELISYLIQFKETLEFALMNISDENLSADLVKKLNALGADIQQNKKDREDEVAQVTSKALTVYDVINSELFKEAILEAQGYYTEFQVNFETGELEYTTLKKEEEDNG